MTIKLLLLSLAVSLSVASAHAQSVETSGASANSARFRDARPSDARFSDRGRTLVAGSLSGHWSSRRDAGDDWAVQLSPSIAYFVWDRVGVGIAPGWATGTDELLGNRFQEGSLGVYGIFDIPLGERLSLLAIPTLAYVYRERPSPTSLQLVNPQRQEAFLPSDPGFSGFYRVSSQHSVRLTVHLPVVFHASSSVVLGLGPFFSFDRIVGSESNELFGASESPVAASYFAPERNSFHLGMSSFVGASF